MDDINRWAEEAELDAKTIDGWRRKALKYDETHAANDRLQIQLEALEGAHELLRARLAEAERERDEEKDRRIYYQGIAYGVAAILDKALGRSVRTGTGLVVGTLLSPSAEVQNATQKVIDERDEARAEVAAYNVDSEILASLRRLVAAQANDPGLWFVAQTAPEAYLQQELRKLHAAIEAKGADGDET